MHKYALAYQIVLGGGGNPNISGAAYSWAGRLTNRAITDYAEIVKEATPGLRGLVEKTEQFIALRKNNGLSCKTRDLIANVRGIESVSMAESLLRIANKPAGTVGNSGTQTRIPGGNPQIFC